MIKFQILLSIYRFSVANINLKKKNNQIQPHQNAKVNILKIDADQKRTHTTETRIILRSSRTHQVSAYFSKVMQCVLSIIEALLGCRHSRSAEEVSPHVTSIKSRTWKLPSESGGVCNGFRPFRFLDLSVYFRYCLFTFHTPFFAQISHSIHHIVAGILE